MPSTETATAKEDHLQSKAGSKLGQDQVKYGNQLLSKPGSQLARDSPLEEGYREPSTSQAKNSSPGEVAQEICIGPLEQRVSIAKPPACTLQSQAPSPASPQQGGLGAASNGSRETSSRSLLLEGASLASSLLPAATSQPSIREAKKSYTETAPPQGRINSVLAELAGINADSASNGQNEGKVDIVHLLW